jgi:hypothetical protein
MEKKVGIPLSKTGVILAILNTALIILISLIAYQLSPGSRGASGWLFIYPILWNLPSSVLIMPFPNLPDWILILLIILVGGSQWYLLGWAIEAFVTKVFLKKSR